MVTALGWLAVIALIGGNAFFVAAEFSLTSVDRARLRRLAESGNRPAQRVQQAVRELSFQLSGAQLGITICSLLLGFVAEPVIAQVLRPPLHHLGLPGTAGDGVAVVLALAFATMTQMLLGELVPQNLAISRPLPTALAITPYQRVFARLCRPVIALFNDTANAIVRGLGIEPQEELRAARTPGELATLVGLSAQEGTLSPDVAGLLRRTLAFAEKTAGDVLTPRVQVVALRSDQTAADLLDAARRSGQSRFPVHSGDLDEIVGVVHLKHAFAVPRERRATTPLSALMIEPVLVPESLHCDDLLATLRRQGLQLAVVADEYGGTAGVVTLEDLVEELVGEVRDEHDAAEDADVVPLGDGNLSVSGLLRGDELAERIGLDPPPGHYDTLAGLVLERFGRMPEVGESVEVDGWTLTVSRKEGHRIDRVMIRPPASVPRGARR